VVTGAELALQFSGLLEVINRAAVFAGHELPQLLGRHGGAQLRLLALGGLAAAVEAAGMVGKADAETAITPFAAHGAAAAQAAWLFRVPFVIVRAISDKADDTAEKAYAEIEEEPSLRSSTIMAAVLERIGEEK
jgi:hypothetical protein